MLAELKVAESLCMQVAHCRQVTLLKPVHENTRRICRLTPDNSNQNHSGAIIFFLQLYGEFSFQSQTVKWDPITTHMRCLEEA